MTGTTLTTGARPRRALRTALVGALTLAPFVAAGAVLVPATAAPPSGAELAAGYLEGRLAAGGHVLSQEFGGVAYPDYGVTADAVLAMDAAGTAQDEAAAATAYLEDHIQSYISYELDPGAVYAGPAAKLVNVAVAQGVDPTDFGGVDLLATLEDLEGSAGTPGRFSDRSTYGDNSNLFGQALAVGGLARAGRGPSPESVQLLRDQQCDDGGFPIYFEDGCQSDPDATALAVQALIRVAGAEDTDAREGLDHLAARQDDSTGGVGGSGPTAATNANSTGLAGQAFFAGGRSAQARLAQAYVASLQYGCEFPPALRGGVAYDQAAYDAKLAQGAAAVPSDQDNRSTAQASLALAGTPLFVVTSTGAAAVAPEPDCTATTTTSTATATSSTTSAPPTTSTTTSATGTTTSTTTSVTTSASTTTATTSATAGAGATSGGGSVLGDGLVGAPVRDGSSGRSGLLARTGAEIVPFAGAALALVALGVVLVVVRRTPRGRHQ